MGALIYAAWQWALFGLFPESLVGESSDAVFFYMLQFSRFG